MCQRNMSPWCCMQSFELENIVWCNILLSWKTFVINFNVLLQVTYCFFTSCWLAHNQLSWNVLLFSCNPIGHLYLSGPSYSSQNVRLYVDNFQKGEMNNLWKIWQKVENLIIQDSTEKISVKIKGNTLGSFHSLNYSCPRQPEINVFGHK